MGGGLVRLKVRRNPRLWDRQVFDNQLEEIADRATFQAS